MLIPPAVYLPHRKKKLARPLTEEELSTIKYYTRAHCFATKVVASVVGLGVILGTVYYLMANRETVKSVGSQLEKLAETLAF